MASPAPRVAVVDDDASLAEMLAEALRQGGYDVTAFTDPREALARAALLPLDVLFVDLVMPEMGGLELADRIRDASPDTQVVVLTGHGSIDSAVEGIQHGIFDYIEKARVDHARVQRAGGGIFDVATFYRDLRIWSVTAAVRVGFGTGHRMGRYGVWMPLPGHTTGH